MHKAIFNVEGMSCGHCVRSVENSLGKLSGIQNAVVKVGSAEVKFDQAQVSVETVAETLTSSGYPASVQRTANLPLVVSGGCGCCGTK